MCSWDGDDDVNSINDSKYDFCNCSDIALSNLDMKFNINSIHWFILLSILLDSICNEYNLISLSLIFVWSISISLMKLLYISSSEFFSFLRFVFSILSSYFVWY